MIKHNDTLDIAVASSRKSAKWHNKRTTWGGLIEMLSKTEKTKETLKQYFSYTKDKQDEIKDVGGFVGGYLKEGKRKNGHVEYRQLVSLDVDHGTLEVWEVFTLLDVAGLMYTTHKHTPEQPRFRILFPLDRKVNPDEYEAIARVVANWLGIDNFDDTTFQPTRLMYYPSTAKNGEYLFDFNDAPWLRADEVLAELPDWRDPTTWPFSSRVKEALEKKRGDKVEDPTEKEGVIGAFCRAFTLHEVLEEFLSEIYTPCEDFGKYRYSYKGGSTSGGLVVYDDKLAYSHHSTDPAGGRLYNAFDLVRLHKFGDLDEKARTKEPAKLPSYKAMVAFAGRLKAVKRELIKSRREGVEEYGELEGEAREAAESDEWLEELETDPTGRVKNTIDNAVIILNNDPNLKGRLQLNQLSLWDEASKPFMWDKGAHRYPRPVEDNDVHQIRRYMEKCYEITGIDLVNTAVSIVAHDNSHHPLRDYLEALPEWDGEERIDTLLIRLFGAQDSEYTRAVTRKTFCAAIKRVYEPGTKFDHMLTLIGTGGNGKSTFLSKIGGAWFTDNVKINTDDKQNLAIMRGKWILEIAEMRGFNKVEAEFSKQFLSRTEDIYKRPYDRKEIVFPRQCIFIGTHNKSDFLHDETGNRRYWPIQTTTGKEGAKKVWDYLTETTVALLWAEAKVRVAEGETLYLDREMERMAERVQKAHMEIDSWEEDIARFTADRKEVTTKEIWEMAVGGTKPITKQEQNRIGKIMRVREWEHKLIKKRNLPERFWVKKD